MGRDASMLAADPLRPTEAKLLEKARLALYPDREAHDPRKPAAQFEDWARDLDDYLQENRNNPMLKDLVQKFVVDYVNNPRDEHLPGDTVWTKPRHVDDYRDAYRLPLNYDMEGNVLLMKDSNQPSHGIPAKISGEALAKETTMMSQVTGNLRNGMGFVEVIRDRTYEGDRALAKTVGLRRQYLTLRLLEQGQIYAKESQKP